MTFPFTQNVVLSYFATATFVLPVGMRLNPIVPEATTMLEPRKRAAAAVAGSDAKMEPDAVPTVVTVT